MNLAKRIKAFVYKFDFFHTTQLLRYKKETQYRTLFGGVLSLIIIIALVVTFYNKLIGTINKVIITSTQNNLNIIDPTLIELSTHPNGKFMFGVEVYGLDLNSGNRFFDVEMHTIESNSGILKPSPKSHPLEPCTEDHWSQFSEAKTKFKAVNMNYWLCLPKNQTYQIQGKYTSPYSQFLKVSIRKCTNSSKFSRPCQPKEKIDWLFDTYGYMTMGVYFINPLINPSSEDYLTYYLEDNNFITFSRNLGGEGLLFVEDFSIKTDESILPFSQERSDQGGIISDPAIKDIFEVTSSVYASFSFFKSSIKKNFTRNFQKIDQLLSYIGGLFGTISILLFIINTYNGSSFQITLAEYLYKDSNKNEDNPIANYHFLHFLGQNFCHFFQFFGCKLNWKSMKQFNSYQSQIIKQLDIRYLIQRVLFLQICIKNILSQRQLKGLLLQDSFSLSEVRKYRRNFKIKRLISQKGRKLDSNNSMQTSENLVNQSSQQIGQKGFDLHLVQKINQSNLNSDPNFDKSQLQIKSVDKKDNADADFSSQNESDQCQKEQNNPLIKNMYEELNLLKVQSQEGNFLSRRIWSKISKQTKRRVQMINKQKLQNQQKNIFIEKGEQSLIQDKKPQVKTENIKIQNSFVPQLAEQKKPKTKQLNKTKKKQKQLLQKEAPFFQSFQAQVQKQQDIIIVKPYSYESQNKS